jgi:hypothetical protein
MTVKMKYIPLPAIVAASFLFAIAFPAPAWSAEQKAAQDGPETPSAGKTTATSVEQELLDLSKQKWLWMAERKMDSLDALFHEKAVFVHMGGSMSKEREMETIRSGGIQYKQAEIQEASVQVIGSTAILLNRIRLVAVVGGNEVTNPFMVTEVYMKEGGNWQLGSLSFTRLMR